MKIEIKSWYDGKILFEGEFGSLKLAVEAAVKSKANLRYADLRYADLGYADLGYANLRSADLGSADLGSADLGYADLGYANLRSADLRSANLRYANLRSADLRSANLGSADLSENQLRWFRDDIWAVLSATPSEAKGLREAIAAGKIDGSTYEGDCACLVGTIAKVRGCKYDSIAALKPDSARPAEQWFAMIKKGDTPKENKAAKQALSWVDEWLENMNKAFAS